MTKTSSGPEEFGITSPTHGATLNDGTFLSDVREDLTLAACGKLSTLIVVLTKL